MDWLERSNGADAAHFHVSRANIQCLWERRHHGCNSVIVGQRGCMCFLQRDKCKRSGGVKRPNWEIVPQSFSETQIHHVLFWWFAFCSFEQLLESRNNDHCSQRMWLRIHKMTVLMSLQTAKRDKNASKICTLVALLEELCTINAAEAERQPDKWKTNVNEKKNPEGKQEKSVRSTVVFTHYAFI